MQCPKCQHENPDDAIYCIKCASPMELQCPNCGTITPATGNFCKKCAYDLKKPKETRQIDFNRPQSYTPKFLADKILTSRSCIEGERKLVTVLFGDVANYTAMSEKLDPEEVHQIMDGCFKILMDEIHKYEGTINQFTGDGVMALFGAPVAHEDHANRACHAALAIKRALGEYGEKIKKEYGVAFKMRMGLNSGPVIVGAIGDDLRMDYTAVGDTTNLASRMESLAQPGTILLSKHTYRLVKDYFTLASLGVMEVKGKGQPQEAFELIKAGGAATRIEASVARGLTKFVGRENTMAALMEAYEKVQNGSGQVTGIVGEAGVGKSRLLFEFRSRLPQEEFIYLEGRCIHYGGAMPYLPILDVLKSYFGIVEGEREVLIKKRMAEKVLDLDKKLSETLPALQDLLSLKVEDEAYLELEPKKRKEKVFEALRNLIIRGSQEKPLVLAIEDLHWIDKTSEEFLDYFIGWLATVKVMLILLHRPEYTHPWGSKSYFNRVGVDQLTLKSSAELVKAILEGGETAHDLSEFILNRAAGNPLFMEELTHTLLENGSIQKEQNQYILTRTASEIQVPDTIHGIIAARLDRLEENLKKIMQVASVIGREFAFRILQTSLGMREELKTHLLNLQGLEFIYEKSLFPELEYIFKHALTQEVAYSSLLTKRRKEIHKKIGSAIEGLYAGSLEEFYEVLAYHYTKGEEFRKAYHYLKLSGNKATRNHASSEAFGFYKEAIRLLNKLPETEENKKECIDVIVLMRVPAMLLGYPENSLSFFQQGEQLSKELGDTRNLANIYGAMGSYYSHSGDHSMAIKYTEEAFGEARKTDDIDLIAPLVLPLCTSYSARGYWYTMVDVVPEVINLIEVTGRKADFFTLSVNPYSYLCGFHGLSMAHLGDFEAGKAFVEKGLYNATQVGDLASLGLAEVFYGSAFYVKGDWIPAKDHLEKATAYCEELKFAVGLVLSYTLLGHTYSFLGNLESAKRQAEKGLQTCRDSGIELWLSYNHLVLGMIYLDLGELENAAKSMEEALKLSRKNNERGWEGWSLIGLGRILGRMEPRQMEKAQECFLKGLEILRDVKMNSFYSWGRLFLGELFVDAGEKEKALENLKTTEGMFREMGMDYWLNRTKELLKNI